MNKFRLMSYCATFLVVNILLCAGGLQANKKHGGYLSKAEFHEIANNKNEKYVYLGKHFSNLYEVISRINELDTNTSSVTRDLQDHIDGGFSIGLYNSVIEALHYAERILQKNAAKIDSEEAQDLAQALDVIIDQVVNEALSIDPTEITDINKHCCSSSSSTDSSDCQDCQIIPEENKIVLSCPVKMKSSLKVFGKTTFRDDVLFLDNACFEEEVCFFEKVKFYDKVKFKEDVTFNDEVKFKDEVEFKEDVEFEEDVTIEGTLTVTDLVVLSCIDELCVESLTVIDIIVPGGSCLDNLCVNTLSVTDLVVLSCIDNLCVTNLSVTELAVASCIDNLCVINLTVSDLSIVGCLASLCVEDLSVVNETVSGTLSVNNAVINHLSVNDIVIASCIDSLCVNNLSVVNETVSGTLSVNNAIINNLSVNELAVASCIDTLCVIDLSAVDVSISGTLSANNAVINNLSVTELAVASCIDTLCVINLSAVDVTISGTLSVNEIVASTIEALCDLSVGCNILMHNTTSPLVGNILKDGNRFIHNAGTDNTFVGINAGNFTTTGAENVGVGRNALFSNTTGVENNAVGGFALTTNTIGENNNAMGAFALVNNTTGNENTALGGFTLTSNTIGSGNVAVGFDSGFSLSSGNNNTFVGTNSALFTTTGSTNIIIGFNAGVSLITGDDNIYIGNPGVAAESGTIRIGTTATHTSTFIQGIFGSVIGGTGVPVFIDAAGQLGTIVSSRKFKHNIEDLRSNVSENIYNLRPVSFVYNADETNTKQYGLIAEEVDQVFPELVIRDEDGAPYTVRYHLLPLLLLSEVQKLNHIAREQGLTIKRLKLDNKHFAEMMQIVMEKLNTLSA